MCIGIAIVGIVPIKEGLTNLSFRFSVAGTEYVYRHPGVGTEEIISRQSETFSQGVHYQAGVTCADCHMAYTREGAMKVSNHQVASPMRSDETINSSCLTCHHATADEMRERVEQLGGQFQVRSAPGQGTAVTALIPL